MSYRPTALLTVVRVALVALFTTVTVTPGITPPVESLTSPVMVPSVCAKQGAQRSNDVNPTNRGRRIGRLLPRKGSGCTGPGWSVMTLRTHSIGAGLPASTVTPAVRRTSASGAREVRTRLAGVVT